MPKSRQRLTAAHLSWLTCARFLSCSGKKLPDADWCLAHVSREERAAVLEHIRQGGPVDVGAGVEFSEELFAELRQALPRDDDGRLVVNEADFYVARLPRLNLAGARFQGGARFDGATFRGD